MVAHLSKSQHELELKVQILLESFESKELTSYQKIRETNMTDVDTSKLMRRECGGGGC